ncbi:lytic transglycosylase domain-containing protein [Novosphingobium rosa]|uniref:lytic transglycosylase domain-containing protein n=1 Tax=Novosphingobium rosa TaxID=76978 RepID=UPI001FDF13C4|nr:lytic transglycosylase domain-containing protein [Novosphingobium rosa]
MAHAGVIEIGEDGAIRERGDTAAVSWVVRDHASHHPLAKALEAPGISSRPLSHASAVPEALRAPLEASAARYGVSPHLLAALVWQESRWHVGAVSPKGAIGLAQLMPATARQLAVDPRDPRANLDGGAHYLRLMLDRFGGHTDLALAAYNAGARRVLRRGGIPQIAETRAYVSSILQRMTGTPSPAGTALAMATPETGIIDTGFTQ